MATETFTHENGMTFVRIPAGTFDMGSEEGNPDERPVHKAEITKDYFLATTPCTNEQFHFFFPEHLSDHHSVGDKQPVVSVLWLDAFAYCKKLCESDGRKYRLPTEAEWEWAYKAGTTTPFYWGDADPAGQASYVKPGGVQGSEDVGLYPPNPWGLYDMAGNVAEWCADWYDNEFYASEKATQPNPKGPVKGVLRVLRGGSWNVNHFFLRATARSPGNPTNRNMAHGFRVLCEAFD